MQHGGKGKKIFHVDLQKMIDEDRAKRFLKRLKKSFRFKLFLLTRLPLALLAGLRLEEAVLDKTVISIPFTYFSKNPFRSTYFAALSMAAEMSTGIPGFVFVMAADKPISMLLTDMEGQFSKKAVGRTYFSSEDGWLVREAVARASESTEAQTVWVRSIGRDSEGKEICRSRFHWSFKAKKKPLQGNEG